MLWFKRIAPSVFLFTMAGAAFYFAVFRAPEPEVVPGKVQQILEMEIEPIQEPEVSAASKKFEDQLAQLQSLFESAQDEAFEEKLLELEKAFPKSSELKALKADYFYLNAEYQKSLDAIEEALEHSPQNEGLRLASAELLVVLDRKDEAESVLEKLFDEGVRQRQLYRDYLTLVGPENALEKFENREGSDDVELKLSQAEAYRQMHNNTAYRAQLEEAVELQPKSIEALALLSREVLLQRDFETALELGQRIHGYSADDFSFELQFKALLGLNRRAEAASLLELWSNMLPDSPPLQRASRQLKKLEE